MTGPRELASILRPDPGLLTLRQGTVDAVNSDGTIDVTIGGSTVVIPTVPHLGAVAKGAAVWLLQQRRDLLALATPQPDLGWNAPSLDNSWTDYGSGWETAGWRFGPPGFVMLKGLVKDGTASKIFNLPVGARPPESAGFAVPGHTSGGVNGMARINVATSGDVDVSVDGAINPLGSGAYVFLSGIVVPLR